MYIHVNEKSKLLHKANATYILYEIAIGYLYSHMHLPYEAV